MPATKSQQTYIFPRDGLDKLVKSHPDWADDKLKRSFFQWVKKDEALFREIFDRWFSANISQARKMAMTFEEREVARQGRERDSKVTQRAVLKEHAKRIRNDPNVAVRAKQMLERMGSPASGFMEKFVEYHGAEKLIRQIKQIKKGASGSGAARG